MRMILCNKCGHDILGSKLRDTFKDKCQICGKIRQCSKYDIPADKKADNEE